ncbi:MAG: hypothetical protein LBD86_03040 [Spirochaetaceae bacterium]|jgi:hypothetical protein|nr:hypothetical protein [Spirochaetaceae bacterium]
MKKFLKSAALIAVLAFVACEQAELGPAGEFLPGIANLNTVKGITAPPTTWTQFTPLPFPSSSGVTVDMVRGLATDGTFLVATGSDGTYPYATRYDTVSGVWTTPFIIPGFTVNPGAAHFLNAYFLITGGTTSSYGAYSKDGLSWAQTGLIGFGTKAGVYGPAEQLYVVAGQNGQAAYTYDPGQPFTTIPQIYTGWSGTGSTAYINAGAYGNGVYVFGGGSGRLAWTATILSGGQPVSWTTASTNPLGSTDFVNAIAYGNETFVAAGNTANDTGIIVYSPDNGVTWNTANIRSLAIGQNAGIFALTFGNGYFVASDNDDNFAYSNDGATWTGITSTVFKNPSRINVAVCYDAVNAFLVAGQDASGLQAAISK